MQTKANAKHDRRLPSSQSQHHSTGEFFPLVLFQRERNGSIRYYIQYKGVEYLVTDSLQGQSAIARRVVVLSKKDWVSALNQAQDAYLSTRTSL